MPDMEIARPASLGVTWCGVASSLDFALKNQGDGRFSQCPTDATFGVAAGGCMIPCMGLRLGLRLAGNRRWKIGQIVANWGLGMCGSGSKIGFDFTGDFDRSPGRA